MQAANTAGELPTATTPSAANRNTLSSAARVLQHQHLQPIRTRRKTQNRFITCQRHRCRSSQRFVAMRERTLQHQKHLSATARRINPRLV